ncbi:MAG TPA: hypothetical protein VFI31_18165 [Pirellulales bacterium]|nr:hypothetical protein [Pirellulales bacterium]
MNSLPPGNVPPPPPQRSKTNYLLIIVPLAVFGMLALMVMFGAGLFLVLKQQGAFAPPPPRPQDEPIAEKRRDNAEAFAGDAAKSDAGGDLMGALTLLLTRTTQMKTTADVRACFDLDRMYREVQAQAQHPDLSNARQVREAFAKGFAERLAGGHSFAGFESSEIRKVKQLDGADDVVVFSKHRTEAGIGVKMRWWAHRERGKWRWYDFEDLDTGLRSTAGAAAAVRNTPQQSEALEHISKAGGLLAESRFEEAGTELRSTLGVPLPKAFDGLRHAELAIVDVNADAPEQALEELDLAETLVSDMAMLPMLRARAFNALGRWEEAAAQARIYLNDLGADDFGFWLLGTALAGMDKKDEAADAFRQGLKENPASVNNLVALAGVLPEEAMAEVADFFAAFPRPTLQFVEVAGQFLAQGNAPALAAIVERHRSIAPYDPHNDYYEGQYRWLRQEYDQAADAFRKALDNMPEDERVGCQKALRNSLLYAGKPADAYQAMPNGDDTFLAICNRLVSEGDADGLDTVAALHAERQPDDTWLPYFRGEALVLRGKYEQAVALFKPMLEADLSAGARASYRNEYLSAEINAGHALEAYQTVPDADEAFLKAANQLLGDRNSDDLEKLVALHAERQPDDPYVVYFRGEVPYLRGESAEAAAIFEPLLKRDLPDGLREPCYREYLRSMSDLGKPIDGYRAVPDAALAFKFLADALLERWNGADQLEKLFEAHRERLPQDPWLSYYRGRLLILRSRYDEAAELLAPLVAATQDEQLKGELAEACRAALAYAGKPQEAYAISLDRAAGFERTAAYLANKLDAGKLAALIATREAEQADDPSLPYYQARVAALGGDYRTAAEILTPAVAAAAETEQRNRLLNLLLDSLYQIHEAAAAGDIVRPSEAFNFLASRLADDGNADLLEKTLIAYQAEAADDPRLAYYRGRLEQLRGHDDEAAAAVSEWFKTVADEDDDESLETYLDAMTDAHRPLEAYQSASNKPTAFRFLAGELAVHGDAASLESLNDLHAKEHADDPWLGYWRGRALLLRGKEDESVETFQAVLRTADDESPGLVPSAWRELLLLGKPLEAHRASADATEAFEYLGDSLLENHDISRLRQLVAAHEADHADDPALAWLKAELLVADAQFIEAVDLLKPLLSDEETPFAYRYEMLHRRAAVKAGRAIDLYAAADDKQQDFRTLASALYEAEDPAGLAALIDAHRAREPKDPWLAFYTAQQLRLAHQYDDADRGFAAALADREATSLQSPLTAARIETRYEAGQAVSAYEEIVPRLATFNALIDLCRNKRDAKQFTQLLDAHRERFPNDARLPGWELEVADWQGNDEAVLHVFETNANPFTADEQWRAQGLRVRALVRLKRFDDARAVLDAYQRFQPAPFYRALVEAAAGNAPAAMLALYECLRRGSAVQYLYQDPDLGPALRSEAMTDFRQRHPEPPVDKAP